MRRALCLLALLAACSSPEDPPKAVQPIERVVYNLERVLGPDIETEERPGPEELVDLIRDRIEPAFWETSTEASIEISGDPYVLTVQATREVQKAIAAYLERIRAGQGTGG